MVAASDPLNAYVGTWTGNIRYDMCSGGLRRGCSGLGSVSRFQLRLAQSGTGVFGLFLPTADVSGSLGPDGRLALTGADAPVTYELGYTEIPSMIVGLSDAGTLEGNASLLLYPPKAISEVGPMRITATLFDGLQQPEAVVIEPFSGTWGGWFEYVVTIPPFLLDPVRELSLSLNQRGSTVTGTMNMTSVGVIPVSGYVAGDTLILTGEVARNGTTIRLVEFTAQRSAVGRLTGSYRLEYPTGRPEFLLARMTQTGPPQ